MFEELKKVIVDTVSCQEDAIVPEAKIKEDLGLDSLDAVELNMAVEEAFGITIPDEELANFVTVQNILDYIAKAKA